MAITNLERVGKALDLLKDGLKPFVERELRAQYGEQWFARARDAVGPAQEKAFAKEATAPWDAAALLAVMWNEWNLVFKKTLGSAERTLVSELRDVRNKWAHQNAFTGDDAYRALDSVVRLLTAVSAAEAAEVEKMRMELLRVRFDEQMRTEKRRGAGAAIESQVTGQLKPWREVVHPHPDVASGRYQQAEFAADLWQVHLGEGSDEYRDSAEFFRRTFLTDSLRRLLVSGARRVAGKGGDPVVQLQTNFGGGKTHSMLALYHLFSGTKPADLAGVDALLAESGVQKLPAVRRVVLVGNKISPGNPVTKPDGTVVRTLWGELAWQLGGKKAFARLRADDERATNPGDVLRELFNEHGPCLVLIDEWVAYARQLHDQGELPGGNFETHFTFAQALTEAAKAAKGCLVVISLPASDTGGSPHTLVDDVEVGGQRGREALDRLRNAIGRVESPWRPASAEEGFEIVRRRLFEPLVEREQFVARDTVARAFYDSYRTQPQEFPPDCREADYEKKMRAAYPIHPEVFDRLYSDWSSLVKFQRTRGVLRLMAAVIHSLWEKGDRNPLILPGNLPIDDPRVEFELTRYLSDNWVPVIEKDVDGANSLPFRLDGEIPNLGRFHACRRVARTIYLGSAPTLTAAHQGIEDRRIKLGCAMPGESINVFGDALRRLAGAATYLYQDGARYWYSTQPTVTKLAEDRAEQMKRDPDKVFHELDRRLRSDLRHPGDFAKIHALPASTQDVGDEPEVRLVVLGSEHPHAREGKSAAIAQATQILESRGTTPRRFRNALVFLAADQARLQDLDEALRQFLAWDSILAEREALNLTPQQVRQTESRHKAADAVVVSRLPETYQWLLTPTQDSPRVPPEWKSQRLSGQEVLAVRASKKLRGAELLILTFAGSLLRLELDRVPLWREGDAVSVRQLVEDFASYLYLPRLAGPKVLVEAIQAGLGLLTWESDSFAYAESYDASEKRFRGLRAGERVLVTEDDRGLLVRPQAARAQLDAEIKPEPPPGPGPGRGPGPGPGPTLPLPTPPVVYRRYHGSVALSPTRVGADAGRIAEEVIGHLTGLIGAEVRVTLEIEAHLPGGAPDNVVRTVTENGRTLRFGSQGFEKE